MNNNLKICIIIYIIMSNIDKSIVSNLEGELGSIDYGEDELNQAFKSLDEETKKKILKYQNKDIQISILRNILNQDLKTFYEGLPELEKNKIICIYCFYER